MRCVQLQLNSQIYVHRLGVSIRIQGIQAKLSVNTG